ncbi:Arm DNA-binding domain-containing protein [Aliamphritea spongicola]|nr:Arm DNA-binding domain-containing protein [Aliamphritea spongicola]
MSKKFNPTNDRIRSLPANDKSSSSTELEVTDTELTGLKCLSGKSGNKRFLLRYTFNGRKRSINLGRFPDIDVAAARKAIRSYRAMLAKGRDPKGEQEVQQQIPTVSEFFWHTFLPLQKKHKKTWKSDIERFKLHIEPLIGHLRYTDLKTTHVQQIQLKLNEPTKDRPAYANATCNRVLAVLKSMGQFAVRFDIVPVNEAMKIKLLKEDNVRTRFLDAGKMKALIREALAYKRTPKSMRLSPFRRSLAPVTAKC